MANGGGVMGFVASEAQQNGCRTCIYSCGNGENRDPSSYPSVFPHVVPTGGLPSISSHHSSIVASAHSNYTIDAAAHPCSNCYPLNCFNSVEAGNTERQRKQTGNDLRMQYIRGLLQLQKYQHLAL